MANNLGTRSDSLEGLKVIDENGASVGFVSDVIRDNGSIEPAWLVVDCGWLRSEHYVPAEGSLVTSNDEVILPFEKKWVRAAPKAAEGHVLTSAIRRRLAVYYG
jgi:uncharacterized protein YrrD